MRNEDGEKKEKNVKTENENHFLQSKSVFKFSVAAFAAGISVFVFGEENARSAFWTEFV